MPFHATIQDGKIEFPSAAAAMKFQTWKLEHDGAHVIIDQLKPERSTSQLRMYRAWLDNTATHTGNDPEELHAFLLDKCAPRVVVTITGSKGKVDVEQIKRTSGGHKHSMTKDEMSEFMDRCASLTGYPLPTKEELEAMGYISNY